MSGQELIEEFPALFPEYNDHYREHIAYYGELLLHVFCSEVINIPLFDLLKKNNDSDQIKKYVEFVDHMRLDGDEAARNVVDVTILERLSDDKNVWNNLSSRISEDFRDYINKQLIENCAMCHVKHI